MLLLPKERSRLKMWTVKIVHLPERVGNFNRYKRLILASLISAILIISIIYMRSFLPTVQSGSDGSYNYFELYIRNATLTNVTMRGPCVYNSTEGPIKVTNVTADVANLLNMSLIKEGSRLELGAPSAFATKMVVYTTYLTGMIPIYEPYLHWIPIECYGNGTLNISFTGVPVPLLNMSMTVVYLYAESFSAQNLSLTCI